MIRLRTLGATELRDSQGEELRGLLAQPKRMALLAYLALATPRGFQPRDTLLALFWPEHDTDHARNSLNQSVHALRRALGADVVVSRNGDALGLNWPEVWCDAVAFEEALEAGRLGEALELNRGELLDGFHVAGAPDFERWLDAERVRLASRYVKAAELFAQEREAAGDVESSVTLWRRLATRDPYNSRIAVRLMRALAASGDPAGAIQYARVHETLLREELNVAPDPEVAAFVRQLESRTRLNGPHRRPDHLLGSRSLEAAGAANKAIAPSSAAAEPGPTRVPPASGAPWTRLRRPITIAAAVVAFGGVGVAVRNETGPSSIPPIRSLAVLPLENLSGDSAHQWFADGMHDALITELARYPGLSVISRTSVMRYRGPKKTVPEIARELNVDGVVEGTLFWEGGQVRMNVQLVHATDRHVWARSYRRDLREVLVLQGELAEAIAREVKVASSPLSRSQPKAKGPPDSVPEAIYLNDLYRRGRHAEISRTLTALLAAKEAYQRAIDRDSTFALGYAGLAGIYRLMVDYAYVPAHPALDSARVLAERAVALDSTQPEAHTALALTLGDAGKFDAAEGEYKRAIELSPSNARAHYWYAILLVSLGRGEEALREINRSAELDPFSPRGVTVMQRYATFLITGDRPYLRVPVETRRMPVSRLDPGEAWAIGNDARDFAYQGKCSEARAEMARARRMVPAGNVRMLMIVAEVHWYCGERARARAVVREMTAQPLARDNGFWIAAQYALHGETDSAFVWLDRQAWTTPMRTDLRCHPSLDRLRSDPRYAQLLRKLGLPVAIRSDS